MMVNVRQDGEAHVIVDASPAKLHKQSLVWFRTLLLLDRKRSDRHCVDVKYFMYFSTERTL